MDKIDTALSTQLTQVIADLAVTVHAAAFQHDSLMGTSSRLSSLARRLSVFRPQA
jgi:hypothetical protein